MDTPPDSPLSKATAADGDAAVAKGYNLMTRAELVEILNKMYHISGVEETGIANALILAEYDRLVGEQNKTCLWLIDSDPTSEIWETSCGNTFIFETGTPGENNFEFCPYCGCQLTTETRPVDRIATWICPHCLCNQWITHQKCMMCGFPQPKN
jgi:hypothetical protein